jgi:hypothetical protein
MAKTRGLQRCALSQQNRPPDSRDLYPRPHRRIRTLRAPECVRRTHLTAPTIDRLGDDERATNVLVTTCVEVRHARIAVALHARELAAREPPRIIWHGLPTLAVPRFRAARNARSRTMAFAELRTYNSSWHGCSMPNSMNPPCTAANAVSVF